MSTAAIELIRGFVILLTGREPDPSATFDLATKLDKYIGSTSTSTPQMSGIPNQFVSMIPQGMMNQGMMPQSMMNQSTVKQSTRSKSGTKYCDTVTFENSISSGKIICSYVSTKGEHKGCYCGSGVTEENRIPSLPLNSQLCKAHSKTNKIGTVDNSANAFNGTGPGYSTAPFEAFNKKPLF